MLKITPLLSKTVNKSFFDEFADPRKDYEFDFDKMWITEREYENITNVYPYFSSEILIEGILFKKSNKSDWFRNRYYELHQDRLVCFKDASKSKIKGIMILRGVRLEIFENLLDTLNLSPNDDYESFEKKIFLFSRNEKFYSIYAGTSEIYKSWHNELKKVCILANFNRYYTNKKIIGKGTFAKVLHSTKNGNKSDFAVKTFEKEMMYNSKSSNRSRISLLNEINLMRRFDHPNIIKMYEVYEGEFHIYMVLEFLNGGELFDRIVKKGNYSEKDAAILIARLLQALEYLHQKGVMHRDIKPENLLLKDEMSFDLKLADFGLSEIIGKKENLFTRCGTPGYVAPEVLEDKKYDCKCDIFSAGVILYILLTGCSPFFGKNYQEILSRNRKGEVSYNFSEKLKLKLSEDATSFMKLLMSKDPEQRPSANQALTHPWILNNWVGFDKDSKYLSVLVDNNMDLSEVQRNLAAMKLRKIETNIKKISDIVTNTPILNGKDSPVLNQKGLNEFSSYEKSCLSKYGYINQTVLETETGLSPYLENSSIGMSSSYLRKEDNFSPFRSLSIDSPNFLTPLTAETKNVARILEFSDSKDKTLSPEKSNGPSHFKKNYESGQTN